jgi:hypothetical protein
MAPRNVWINVGWLFVLVAVFAVPLTLDGFGRLTYFWSLTMWALPVAYLWPVFNRLTADGRGRRRRAVWWTIGSIVVLGVVLDFLLGHLILRFAGCGATPSPYVACLPAVNGSIPVEEILFYALGPAAIVLVYACADERWMRAYNPPDDLLDMRLIHPSGRLMVTAVVAAAALVAVWQSRGTFPTYAAFLAAGALLPAIALYRSVHTLVNWQAFAVTTLYVIVTSVVWEVTLAIPRRWWGYETDAMLGILVDAWSGPGAPFPIEAAFVWLCVPFSTILSYEFAKALMHHPGGIRSALFGPHHDARRVSPVGRGVT